MQTARACQYILDLLTRDLSPKLTYHTALHTCDVVTQARRIALAEGICDAESLALLTTAAHYHDSGFLHQYDEHEAESCRLAQTTLPGFAYTPPQVDAICQMIRATRLPQTPVDALGQILCDADLDYLGRDDYAAISQTLITEWLGMNRLSDASRWLGIQQSFLSSHDYFTATNQALRSPGKQKNLDRLRMI